MQAADRLACGTAAGRKCDANRTEALLDPPMTLIQPCQKSGTYSTEDRDRRPLECLGLPLRKYCRLKTENARSPSKMPRAHTL